MRFLLRCIVCLGTLYAVILHHDGYLVDPARLAETALAVPRQAGMTITTAARSQIAAHVEAYCRQETAACLAEAAALADPVGAAHAAPQRKGRLSFPARAP